jgi:hypothetical protein
MLTVYLSESEEQHVAKAAAAVNDNKERVGKPNVAWSRGGVEQSPLQTRTDAFRAEFAVNKALGLDPLNWEIFEGGDGNSDITLPFYCILGSRIQVKHRNERNRDLATSSLDHHKELKGADIFVLTWPSADQTGIDLVGWCFRNDFLSRIMDMRRPPVRFLGLRYEMKWDSDLRDIEELIEEVQDAARQANAVDRDFWEDEVGEDDAIEGAE